MCVCMYVYIYNYLHIYIPMCFISCYAIIHCCYVVLVYSYLFGPARPVGRLGGHGVVDGARRVRTPVIYIYIYNMKYIYIYIYRERERCICNIV